MVAQAEHINSSVGGIEWRGNLAQSVSHRALFSLYLALASEADNAIRFTSPTEPVEDTTFPERLNQYRQPPLAANDKDYAAVKPFATYLQHSNLSAHLWLCMHPQPLALKNDATQLPPDVLHNSSWRSQQRLTKSIQTENEQEINATLLNDLIPQAQAMSF